MASFSYVYDILDFQMKYDIPPRMIPIINRYRELLLKELPTASETEELNTIKIALKQYDISAEDYNKMFTVLINIQKFVTTDLTEYLNGIFAGYEASMQRMETEHNDRITTIDAWYADIQTSLFDKKYFEFENYNYRKGFRYETQEETTSNFHTFTTKIINEASGEVYATQTSTENLTTGVITERTICNDMGIDTTITITEENGVYKEVVS